MENIFRNTNLETAFRATNTIHGLLHARIYSAIAHHQSGIYQMKRHTCKRSYIGQTVWKLEFKYSIKFFTFVVPCITIYMHIKSPTRCNTSILVFIARLLYMFRILSAPIIRSTINCSLLPLVQYNICSNTS
jgi:hypothetical protein